MNEGKYHVLLWNSFRAGDENAFEELYRTFYKSLYSYGKKVFRKHQWVDDAINDLFFDLWKNRDRVSEVTQVKFYLFTALRHRLYRKEESQGFVDIDNYFESTHADLAKPSVEADIVNAEEDLLKAERVRRLLQNLPPRQYEVLMLRFFEGFSFEEIAEMMKISSQTARNFAQRGINSLRVIAKVFILLLAVLALL